MKRWLSAASILCSAGTLGGCGAAGNASAEGPVAPRFEIDPLWPKPLPNHWIIGSTVGVAVDSRDHVWIIHTRSSIGDREAKARRVDAGRRMLHARAARARARCGRQPRRLVGRAGRRLRLADDAHISKFTRSGQFLAQFGVPVGNAGSADSRNFGRVAKITFDDAANEAFVADGCLNKRVAVLDRSTGEWKRFLGERVWIIERAAPS